VLFRAPQASSKHDHTSTASRTLLVVILGLVATVFVLCSRAHAYGTGPLVEPSSLVASSVAELSMIGAGGGGWTQATTAAARIGANTPPAMNVVASDSASQLPHLRRPRCTSATGTYRTLGAGSFHVRYWVKRHSARNTLGDFCLDRGIAKHSQHVVPKPVDYKSELRLAASTKQCTGGRFRDTRNTTGTRRNDGAETRGQPTGLSFQAGFVASLAVAPCWH
jgi:hypothetical protein